MNWPLAAASEMRSLSAMGIDPRGPRWARGSAWWNDHHNLLMVAWNRRTICTFLGRNDKILRQFSKGGARSSLLSPIKRFDPSIPNLHWTPPGRPINRDGSSFRDPHGSPGTTRIGIDAANRRGHRDDDLRPFDKGRSGK